MAYNLQGIIRKTTTNMAVEFDRLAYVTQIFANVNTGGYKSVRFVNIIDADGSVHGVERTDCRVGEFLMTIKLSSKVKAQLKVVVSASETIKEAIVEETVEEEAK